MKGRVRVRKDIWDKWTYGSLHTFVGANRGCMGCGNRENYGWRGGEIGEFFCKSCGTMWDWNAIGLGGDRRKVVIVVESKSKWQG